MRLLLIVCVVSLTYSEDCTADDATDGVNLWGVCYSIDNTTSLNLGNSALTGVIPTEIGDLVNLTQLKLPVNELTGPIPESIGNLTQLTHLYLYSNQISGELPNIFGDLINLTNLELSTNQLSGEILESIWSSTSLSSLNLSDNQFSGELPDEIDTLSNLAYLRLYANNFSGIIPESICNLSLDFPTSSNFNVTDNNFCPPYPYCIETYVGIQDIVNCPNCASDEESCDVNATCTNTDGSFTCVCNSGWEGADGTVGDCELSLYNGLIPEYFSLHSIYPNPFNPVTNITYGLPEYVNVQIIIYDLSGKEIETLINKLQTPGYHSVSWNGDKVSSGLYICRLSFGNQTITQKMLFMK